MTLTDELKILDDKIKENQAQYDLGREAAKISALPSKDLLEKYEYLTGEDLTHRPSVLEKTKFEYSPLGAVLDSNAKKKTNTNKVNSNRKQDKYFAYNSQYSFTKFKNIDKFKELSLDSMYKKLNDLNNNINNNNNNNNNKLKAVDTETDENKVLRPKVLDIVRDLFNELYYIYKDKYSEKKRWFKYKKWRLTDHHQYESEEEEKEQQTSKKLDKKEPPKKPTQDDLHEFN